MLTPDIRIVSPVPEPAATHAIESVSSWPAGTPIDSSKPRPLLPMPVAGEILGGRYEIVKCIGLGGSCGVYKALDHKSLTSDVNEPCVALKVPRPRFRGDEGWLQNFEAEAATALSLDHRNIVKVFGINRDKDHVFIVMEYLQGAPLTAQVRASGFSGLPWNEVERIIVPISDALNYVHSLGLVHCDVKPSNIFLTTTGEPKLIDFGIARMITKDEGSGVAKSRQVTPAYASPAVLSGMAPDPRDDVYSLACTVFELLTGTHPYGHQRSTDVYDVNTKVPRGTLPWATWHVFQRALALNAQVRTSTVRQFIRELSASYAPFPYIKLMSVVTVLVGICLVNERSKLSVVEPVEDGLEQVVVATTAHNEPTLNASAVPKENGNQNRSEGASGAKSSITSAFHEQTAMAVQKSNHYDHRSDLAEKLETGVTSIVTPADNLTPWQDRGTKSRHLTEAIATKGKRKPVPTITNRRDQQEVTISNPVATMPTPSLISPLSQQGSLAITTAKTNEASPSPGPSHIVNSNDGGETRPPTPRKIRHASTF